MDVVYILKKGGGSYDELRYSLRSLKNLDHERVFIVGGLPGWATGVTHIGTPKGATKWLDAAGNQKAACLSPEISDPFILMNDDFFVMSRVDRIPDMNRGNARDLADLYSQRYPGSRYASGMYDTIETLEAAGYQDVLSFDLHMPDVVDKAGRLESLRMGEGHEVWHVRTAHGAISGKVGETVRDCKVYDMRSAVPSGPFVSTSDRIFTYGVAGRQIRRRFRDKSQYEL